MATRTEQARASELVNGWATLRCRGHSLDALRTWYVDRLSTGQGFGTGTDLGLGLAGESLSLEARDEELGLDVDGDIDASTPSAGTVASTHELFALPETLAESLGEEASSFLSLDMWQPSTPRTSHALPSPRDTDLLGDPWDHTNANAHSLSTWF